MKFEITRASMFGEKPCEESKGEEEKRKTVFGKEYIRSFYTLEINNLDELMAFINKYGDIVIYKNNSYSMPEIKIYDTYIE